MPLSVATQIYPTFQHTGKFKHVTSGMWIIIKQCKIANVRMTATTADLEKKRGAGKFNKYARWNQSRRNSELICDDCIDKKRCDGPKCDAILNKSAVSAREWKYKQTHPDSYLLCSNCRAKGFSKKDNKLYQCTSCKEMLGCKCFDTDELYRMKRSK